MTTNEVSENVVRTDRRLDNASDAAQEDLARHRWHWTLDESNPRRVSVRAYAKAIGRNYRTVIDQVNGFAKWVELTDGGAAITLSECIERAKLRGEAETATEAVATARGVAFGTARRHHSAEVASVRATAQHRAERRGTSTASELPKAAQDHVRQQQHAKTQKARKAQAHGMRFIEVEGLVAQAMDKLRKAFAATESVNFTQQERDLLTASLANLRALLDLVDLRVTGTTRKVDWDAELRKLVES